MENSINEPIKEKEIKLSFKNYKKIDDFTTSLSGSYLYLVKGANNTGKTSLMEALISLMTATNLTPNAITNGKDISVVIGTIPTVKGDYTVEMTITKASTSFIMITPDNVKVKSISEIRKIFEYNSLSVEEFIKKSYTPEGRREQIKTILELLPEESKSKYTLNLQKLDPKKSIIWEKRKNAKINVDKYTSILESISYDDVIVNNIEELKEKHSLLITEKSKSSPYTLQDIDNKLTVVTNDYENTVKSYDDNINENLEEIERLKTAIEKLIDKNQNIHQAKTLLDKTYADKCNAINELKINIILPDPQIEEKINDSFQKLTEAGNHLQRKEQYETINNTLQESIKEFKYNDAEIEKIRLENKQILSNSDLSELGITIEDDTLYIGNYVFNEHQVADSKLILITAAIMAKTLKKSQILCVGKLAELDKYSKEELFNIGKLNNIAIIGDDVDDNYDNIYVKAYEETNIGERTDISDFKVTKTTPTLIPTIVDNQTISEQSKSNYNPLNII